MSETGDEKLSGRVSNLEHRADEQDRRTGEELRELSEIRSQLTDVTETVNYQTTVLVALAKGLNVTIPPPPDDRPIETTSAAGPYANGNGAAMLGRGSSSDLARAVEQAAELASKVSVGRGRSPKEWAKLATGVAAVVAALATLVAQLSGWLH